MLVLGTLSNRTIDFFYTKYGVLFSPWKNQVCAHLKLFEKLFANCRSFTGKATGQRAREPNQTDLECSQGPYEWIHSPQKNGRPLKIISLVACQKVCGALRTHTI